MPSLKITIATFIFLIIAWLASYTFLESNNIDETNKLTPVSLGGHVFYVEVVSDQQKLEKGLGERRDLCDSCGMLFKFKDAGKHSFWMKDMLIPLDIIWISQNKVVHIEKNIQPDFKGTLNPSTDANLVLEINAGKVDELGIKMGDIVDQL